MDGLPESTLMPFGTTKSRSGYTEHNGPQDGIHLIDLQGLAGVS